MAPADKIKRDWRWPAAAGALFVLAYAAAGYVRPVAALFGPAADPATAVVGYLCEGRPFLEPPAAWLRAALFLYPALFCFALAAARRFGAGAGLTPPAWAAVKRYILLYAAALAVLVGATWLVFGGAPRQDDEAAYILQARIFAHGRLWAERPPTEKPWAGGADDADNFFVGHYVNEVVKGDRWFTTYAPAHPLFLALGFLAGIPWAANPLVAAAVPALLAALAAAAGARETRGWAAALALTSPFWIFNGASFMSEGSWLALYALFLLLFWRALQKPSRGRFALAGAALGLAALTREWTTLISALPFAIYAGALALRRGRRVAGAAWFFLGLAPFAATYYLYNVALTAEPLRLARSFSRVEHFGFDENHTLYDAARWAVKNVYVASSDLFGWPLLCVVPLAAYPFLTKSARLFAKLYLAAAATTFAGNFVVRDHGIVYGARYYAGLYPGAVVLTAAAFAGLRAKLKGTLFPGGGARVFVWSLLAGLVVINAAVYFPRAAARNAAFPLGYEPWATSALRRAVAALDVGPAVVFIEPRERCPGAMPNDPAFDDDVIYARHQFWRDREVMAFLPGRRYFVCDYGVFEREGTLFEITPRAGDDD